MPAIQNLIPTRYIGLHHIALFRAFFEESLNLADIADRYLETGRDLVAARRTLIMVQDALIAAGMRRDYDLDKLALLRVPDAVVRGLRDFAALAEQDESNEQAQPEHPSFEDFVLAYDPDGFFSQEEQLEHYYDHYPSALKTDTIRYGAAKPDPTHTALTYLDDRPDGDLSPSEQLKQALGLRQDNESQSRHLKRLEARIRTINELEPVAAAEPALDDLVYGWFDPRVARRLSHAGLETLGHIIDCANHNGYRWFTHVPKLGELTSVRIIQWLKANESNLMCEIQPWALTPRQQLTSTLPALKDQGLQTANPAKTENIAPLERFSVPQMLDGSNGTNRYPQSRNRLRAINDYEAIYTWLDRYRQSPNTYASYRKEAERLLLWAIKGKGKPLSSIDVEDATEYVQFLFDPQPASLWVANKRYPRFHPEWRPFVNKNHLIDRPTSSAANLTTDLLQAEPTGSMTRDSIKLSLTIVNNMFNWLVSQLYLETNPFAALPNFRSNRQIKAHRSFSQRQWELITSYIQELDATQPLANRLIFTLRFGFGTGLRLNEIVKITTSDFTIGDLGPDLLDVWFLNVKGKGQKERQIPLPRSLVKEVRRYLMACSLPDDPRLAPANTPLFASPRDPDKPIFHSVLYRQVKDFFNEIATDIQTEEPALAKYFRGASTHWLRHTHGTLAVQNGVSLPTVMQSLGHASLKTTSIYVRAQDEQRLKEMEKFLGGE